MIILRVERNTAEKTKMTEYNQRDAYFEMLKDFVAKAQKETGHYHRLKALESIADMVAACRQLENNDAEETMKAKELAS